MTRTVLQATLALVLLVSAAVLWTRARGADRSADAMRALAALRYGDALDVPATAAIAHYWRGEYGALPSDADPLLAANAAYRRALRPGGSAREVVSRLDEVVRRYAEVLRDSPDNVDAAFNYEFVVRHRAAIAARGVPVPAADEQEGLTPHGRVGGPVRGTGQQQFKVLVPMRPDERREAEEAGKSGRKVRKG